MNDSAFQPPNSHWLSDQVIGVMLHRSRPPFRNALDERDTVPDNKRRAIPEPDPKTYFSTEKFYFTNNHLSRKRIRDTNVISTTVDIKPSREKGYQANAASALKLHRERRRVTQIRYRQKLRKQGATLEEDVQLLRDEVHKLEQQHRRKAPRIIAKSTPLTVVVEYFRLFRYGLTVRVPILERCSTSDLPNVYESYAHREFLEATMAPNVFVDNGQGVEAILEWWRFISLWQPNIDIQVVKIENCPSGSTVVATTMT